MSNVNMQTVSTFASYGQWWTVTENMYLSIDSEDLYFTSVLHFFDTYYSYLQYISKAKYFTFTQVYF